MKSCGLLLAILLLLVGGVAVAGEPFPVYDEIRPNIAFWQDIYGRYPSTAGVLHDRRDLEIIYTQLEVENTWDSPARRRNRATINQARQRYRRILLELAKDGQPENAEQRRVLALFGDKPTAARLRRAADNIRFQRGLKDRFREGVSRSGAYLARIKEIMRENGLPEDLAYLPHVESSFNYEAYSRLGAAGIWQFMRATGRQYMTVDYVLDERRDPIRASHAAARLLRDNYQRLGSWPLAITAYNHGANGMARAVARYGDYPTIFRQYNSNLFGFASRNFYAEFLAARQVAKNAEDYFGPLQRAPVRRSHEVVLPGYVPFAELVRQLKIDAATLRRYNPGLRPPVFRGEKYLPKGYHLRVPAKPEVIRRAAELPPGIMLAKQKRSAFYTVRRGDTAWEIARRHGVGLHELIAINQLDGRATIYAGQNLRIPGEEEETTRLAAARPVPAAEGRQAAESPADTPAVVTPGEGLELPTTGEVPEPAAEEPAVAAVEQVGEPTAVVKSETATADEAAPTVPESRLAALGSMVLASARDSLAPGDAVAGADGELLNSRQALALSGDAGRLPAQAQVAATAEPEVINPAVVAGHIRVERTWREDGRLYGEIRVEVEETLGHYADWLGIATQRLRRLNGFAFGRPIRLDQRLRLPLDSTGQDVFEEQRYEFHKALIEDFYAAYQVEGVDNYRIRTGDSIWSLSRERFELPLWLLRQYNPGLALDDLKPGQEIKVPQVVAINKVTSGE
ncbi:MAG: LysM peptidoglycan-binding domain-containing protein [Desulfurivibrio sp.]|nr:LysM peptidoglycan-binding domain-containing protein [Desulfurivibrio sp.]